MAEAWERCDVDHLLGKNDQLSIDAVAPWQTPNDAKIWMKKEKLSIAPPGRGNRGLGY